MCKCFLQFTAVAISMKFKLEEPHRALSPSTKPCSVETLVLLGLTLRRGWIAWGSQPPGVGCGECPSAVGAQDS